MIISNHCVANVQCRKAPLFVLGQILHHSHQGFVSNHVAGKVPQSYFGSWPHYPESSQDQISSHHRLNSKSLFGRETTISREFIKLPEQLLDKTRLAQSLPEQPFGFSMRGVAYKAQSKKSHKGNAVQYLVCKCIIREIVKRLNYQNFEHHYNVAGLQYAADLMGYRGGSGRAPLFRRAGAEKRGIHKSMEKVTY